jgi:hypothetical protein
MDRLSIIETEELRILRAVPVWGREGRERQELAQTAEISAFLIAQSQMIDRTKLCVARWGVHAVVSVIHDFLNGPIISPAG